MTLNGFGDTTWAVITQVQCLGNYAPFRYAGCHTVSLLLSDTDSSWWVLNYCPKVIAKAIKHSSLHSNFKLNCVKYRPSTMKNSAFYLFNLCYLISTNTSNCFGLSFPYICNDGVRILVSISTFIFCDFCLKNLNVLFFLIHDTLYCE